jgi:hypothetical protein
MDAIRHRTSTYAWLRILLGLLLGFTLLPWSLGVPTPASAQEPVIRDHRDPYARVLLEIKRVTIHDDMDWGAGEISIGVKVYGREESCPVTSMEKCGQLLIQGGAPQFSASDGAVKQLDRVVPSYGDTMNDRAISPAFGIPFRPGMRYGFDISGVEWDAAVDDKLGMLRSEFTDEAGHIRFGTHTERGIRGYVGVFDFGLEPANFSVEYEIRRAPLPDLRPGGIKVHDLPGNPKKLVCMGIANVELGDAGPFEAVLKIDGVVPEGGKATAGSLASGSGGDLCVEVALPAAGQHELSFVVDEADGVLEFNERNNAYSQPYVAARGVADAGAATGPVVATASSAPGAVETRDPILVTMPAPSSVPAPGATTSEQKPGEGKADLTVTAIRVNGQVPDGKNDCKDGKNDVTVVVKNVGTTKAESFAVRLDVDGDEVRAESEDGLEAGKEREVRFGDVRLKKGEHQLDAALDPENTVAESSEDNNERKVSATCNAD